MGLFTSCIYTTLRSTLLLLMSALCIHTAYADQIDIGLFESNESNQINVKIKPDFRIEADQSITTIRYTIRWSADEETELTNQSISPYNMSPITDPVFHNGYYYQIFLRVIFSSVGTAIEAGEERLIAAFSYSESYCCQFEIAQDDWTDENNGNPYLELQGSDKTGIIYEPLVDLRPEGGTTSGGGTIDPGDETGTLYLQGHDGDIVGWQRRLNEREWEDIPETEGLTSYSEVVESFGNWYYRAIVTRLSCADEMSEPALVQVHEETVNIGIEHTGHGQFEVRLKPHRNISSGISNIQFAIQWPEETVALTGFSSNYDVEKQYTAQDEGYNYAVFVAVPVESESLDWLAAEEYTILSFSHDESGDGTADFVIADNQWTADQNAEFYVERWGENITGNIYQNATDVFIGISRELELYVMLEGPYDPETGEMRTTLNDLNLIPEYQPYDEEPWLHQGGENAAELNEDVVDWVLVELIDAPNATAAIDADPIKTKALLLKNDGSIINEQGNRPLFKLTNQIEHDAFVIVRHRNHMDILSKEPLFYDAEKKSFTMDFRNNAETVLGGSIAYNQINDNTFGMVAGDVTRNGTVSVMDFNKWRRDAGAELVYRNTDLGLSGGVSVLDFNIWRRNAGTETPIQ